MPPEEDGPAGRAHQAHGAMAARLARLAGAVRLSYGLNSPGSVEAVVFDAAGRRVRTLFSGEQAAGEQRLVWNLADASGRRVGARVYFVALDSDGTRTTMQVPVW